jgi:Protein of unknown function (DUF4038)/Putative collagen-binding domain of a collagenase
MPSPITALRQLCARGIQRFRHLPALVLFLSLTACGGGPAVETQPPPPTVNLNVNPASVTSGGNSTLTWSATDATSCTASGGWSGSMSTSGSASTGALTNTTEFTLTCVGGGGSAQATGTVQVTSGPAPTVSLSASPLSVTSGDSSTLTWSSTNATSCTASGGWSGTLPTSGSQVTGALTSTTTYTLSCTGSGGSANSTTTITVSTPSAPTATLTANPTTIASGNSSTLTWSSTNATACTASGGWSGALATNGSRSTGTLTATTGYTLTCTGPGGSASATATVTIGSTPAPTVSLSASPSTIGSGGSSTLTWSSTNATACTASGGWSGTKATSGSQSTGTLTATTGYTLTCTGTGGSGSATATVTVTTTTTGPAYPLVASSNHRYLVDQNGTPVLLEGDGSAQTLFQRVPSVVTTYLTDRAAHGFNALWIHLLVNNQDGGNANGLTDDGIAPFTGTIQSGTCDSGPCYDLSTPNPAYFARVDQIVNIAASMGFVVFMDTLENDSYLQLFEVNGATKVTGWAQYAVDRYKSFSNIVWMTGNDFQSWNTSASDNQMAADIMSTIAAADTTHLQTTELNWYISGSLDDSLLVPYTSLAGVYTYYPTYYEVLKEYNSTARTAPVFLEETYYEGWNNSSLYPAVATDLMLRKPTYWTVLSGGLAGYFYGSIWYDFHSGWQSGIDTTAVTQFSYWKALFTSLAWYNLVPDQGHAIVTAGYGTPTGNGSGNIQTDNYVTAAGTPDGSLVIAYLPASTTITVDMSKLSGTVTAQWYDPTNGTYTAVSGSPFPNSGTQSFASPGNNNAGDPDWVLVLRTH